MDIKLDQKTWTKGSVLVDGEGGFGKVFDVRDEDGNEAVAKFVPKAPGAKRELLMGDSAKVAGFRNIVPVLDKGEFEDQWVIVMPKARRSLWKYFQEKSGFLELNEVINVLRDIVIALVDISGEIVHRDLKPQNVLQLNGTWCIADFGIARYAEASTAADTRKYSLTPLYAAPEQWAHKRATSATDIYAFGVMAYQLISGDLPFLGPDLREQHLTATPPQLTAGTARLRTLIEECLFKAPDARPTAANVLARLDKVAEVPARPGLAKLAQIGQVEARRRSEIHAEALRRQGRADYLAEMHSAAVQSFTSLSRPLLEAIKDNAPMALIRPDVARGGMVFVAELGQGNIGISKPEQAAEWAGPFRVIAHAVITIRVDHTARSEWRGRSHSLWYCDAHEKGRFSWYETAFWAGAFAGHSPEVEPFSATPHEAQVAFSGVIGTMQLAWPLEEIDRADPSEFLDRWIGWFATAAEGELQRPSSMPERQARGSWRRD